MVPPWARGGRKVSAFADVVNRPVRCGAPRDVDRPRRCCTMQAVHVGLFVEEMRQAATQTAAFRDIFDTAERADAPGLALASLGPLHFTPTRLLLSPSL